MLLTYPADAGRDLAATAAEGGGFRCLAAICNSESLLSQDQPTAGPLTRKERKLEPRQEINISNALLSKQSSYYLALTERGSGEKYSQSMPDVMDVGGRLSIALRAEEMRRRCVVCCAAICGRLFVVGTPGLALLKWPSPCFWLRSRPAEASPAENRVRQGHKGGAPSRNQQDQQAEF